MTIYANVFEPRYSHSHNANMQVDYQRLTIDTLAAGKAAEPGYKQETLANAIGTSQAVISRWTTGSTPEDKFRVRLFEEAKRLGLDPAKYGVRDDAAPAVTIPGNQLVGASDLPVYAAAQGGPGHVIVAWDPLRYVRRPDELLHVQEGYGILVTENSMSPAHNHNTVALVNPRRPASRGDEVVLFHTPPDGREAEAMIKLLVGVTARKLTLRQYQPDKTFEVDAEDWPVRHVVVGNLKFW